MQQTSQTSYTAPCNDPQFEAHAGIKMVQVLGSLVYVCELTKVSSLCFQTLPWFEWVFAHLPSLAWSDQVRMTLKGMFLTKMFQWTGNRFKARVGGTPICRLISSASIITPFLGKSYNQWPNFFTTVHTQWPPFSGRHIPVTFISSVPPYPPWIWGISMVAGGIIV